MGYDPNEWTREFVLEHKDFCIRKLKETNDRLMNFLKQGQHEAALTGLDRILNGLVTMVNAGYDYCSHICFFSWIEANVILFGNFDDAPEQNRIKTAKQALLDARDFAKSETAKRNIGVILEDIERGYGISQLAAKYEEDFPNFEIEMLADLNDKLDSYTAPAAASHTAAPAYASTGKKKPWWLAVAAIALLAFIVIVQALNTEQAVKSLEPIRDSLPVATTQSTATEATTEAVDPDQITLQNLVGNWVNFEIISDLTNPDGEPLPDILNESYYTFHEDGTYTVGDASYEAADGNSIEYAEEKYGKYWICVGGGGQGGTYSISGDQLILTTEESVQYGPSTTRTVTFTLSSVTLTVESNDRTKVYTRSDSLTYE